MAVYNVLVGVVHLVEAGSEDEAVGLLEAAVQRCGFETYGEGAEERCLPDAFESEAGIEAWPLPPL